MIKLSLHDLRACVSAHTLRWWWWNWSSKLCSQANFILRVGMLNFWLFNITLMSMFGRPIPRKSLLSRHIDESVFKRGLEKGGQWLGGYWLLSRDSRSHSRSCEGLLQGPLVSHQLYSESKHTNIKILRGPLVSHHHQPDQVGIKAPQYEPLHSIWKLARSRK